MSQGTHTLLGPDASFEGKLDFEGDVRIDGRFRGEIVSNDRLIIGEGATVQGTVRVGTLILNGTLEGQVHVTEEAELQAPGRLIGELYAPSLVIARGVVLDGSVHMLQPEQTLTSATPQHASLSADYTYDDPRV
jgi:cytoskeletal protein CcmA (bactofilin family)